MHGENILFNARETLPQWRAVTQNGALQNGYYLVGRQVFDEWEGVYLVRDSWEAEHDDGSYCINFVLFYRPQKRKMEITRVVQFCLAGMQVKVE